MRWSKLQSYCLEQFNALRFYNQVFIKYHPPVALTGSQPSLSPPKNIERIKLTLIEHTLTDFYHNSALLIVSAGEREKDD